MSTIHHPAHHQHLWLYAAAAVAAGFLAVLVFTVFADSSSSGGTTGVDTKGTTGGSTYQGPTFKEVCFAARPGASIELARAGCADAR